MEEAVSVLIGIGICFMIVGAMAILLNDPVNQIWEDYGLGEAPFELMYMGWNVLPTAVLFLMGIGFISAGAALSRRNRG